MHFHLGAAGKDRELIKDELKKMHEMGGKLIDSLHCLGRAEQVIGELVAEAALKDKFFMQPKYGQVESKLG